MSSWRMVYDERTGWRPVTDLSPLPRFERSRTRPPHRRDPFAGASTRRELQGDQGNLLLLVNTR